LVPDEDEDAHFAGGAALIGGKYALGNLACWRILGIALGGVASVITIAGCQHGLDSNCDAAIELSGRTNLEQDAFTQRPLRI
jgi:hypothetical protein